MPRPCATPSVPPWPIPTTRAAVKATAAPPRAATSSSSSATIAPRSTGTLRVLSSATCAWTIICQFVTSARLGMSHRPGSCATCSTRRSTRFDQSKRRSRSAVTPTPGSKSSRPSPVSTLKARSTVGPTTGRSGVGIANEPKKLSKPSGQRNKRSGHGHPGRPHHPRQVQAQPSAARYPAVQPRVARRVRSVVAQARAQGAPPRAARAVADLAVPSAAVQDRGVRTAQPHAGHVLQDPAGRPVHPGHAPAGPRGARVDQPIRAKSLSRSIARGGR